MGQWATSRAHSITSSAVASSDGGTSRPESIGNLEIDSYAVAAFGSIGSTIDGSSFSSLLTRVEIVPMTRLRHKQDVVVDLLGIPLVPLALLVVRVLPRRRIELFVLFGAELRTMHDLPPRPVGGEKSCKWLGQPCWMAVLRTCRRPHRNWRSFQHLGSSS
jgi:hypothetical protein